jgi:hypothetical protein
MLFENKTRLRKHSTTNKGNSNERHPPNNPDKLHCTLLSAQPSWLSAAALVLACIKGVQWTWHCNPHTHHLSPSVTLFCGVILFRRLFRPLELLTCISNISTCQFRINILLSRERAVVGYRGCSALVKDILRALDMSSMTQPKWFFYRHEICLTVG